MAVVPDFPISEIQEDTALPNRTYQLDLDNGRIVGFVDGMEALRQAAKKALYTPRFDCLAYDDQYGSEIKSLLGNKNVTREYIEAEMEFILKDTLCQDGRITDIHDLDMSFDSDEAQFSFVMDTILGNTEVIGATDDV